MNSRAIRSQKLYRSRTYQNMTRNEKFMFLYLCTTDLLTLTPILNIADKQIAFDTDFSIAEVRKILAQLQEKQLLVRYEDWIFFLHDFAKFEYTGNEETTTKFYQELDSLPLDLLRYINKFGSDPRDNPPSDHPSDGGHHRYKISNTRNHISNTLSYIQEVLEKNKSITTLPEKETNKEKEVNEDWAKDFEGWVQQFEKSFSDLPVDNAEKNELRYLYQQLQSEGFTAKELLDSLCGWSYDLIKHQIHFDGFSLAKTILCNDVSVQQGLDTFNRIEKELGF